MKAIAVLPLYYIIYLFLLCWIQRVGGSLETSLSPPLINYLQQEQIACSTAQQSILQFLKQHQIPIGSEPRSLKDIHKVDRVEDRVITSTAAHPVECRISLGDAPPGSKCVAPCGCSGSQKWVQFSLLNRLRRKDPSQWLVCQTCREPFKYELFSHYGGVKAAIIGLLLERLAIVRGLLFSLFLAGSYALSLPLWISRFLVSRSFWQMYPNALIKLTRLPLPFKFWGGKLLVTALSERYLVLEKAWIISYLADLETSLIESNLPDIDQTPSTPITVE